MLQRWLQFLAFSAGIALAAAATTETPPTSSRSPSPSPHVPPSFRQEIEPILTRAGCNMGGCHGKLAGQNGFKLSLRAYAPELDIEALRDDAWGRRLERAAPEQSLLVLKATGEVPHEGGQRFAVGSPEYQKLVEWIAAGAPGPKPPAEDPDPNQLQIVPGDQRLKPGDTQRLSVHATYPDGQRRDVTWLTQFVSNDPAIASVSPSGEVKGVRHGETAIRAHFQGLVTVVRIALPFTNTVEEFRFGRARSPIDDAVFAKLKSLQIPPSYLCTDEVFLRRVQLDLTGTLPRPEEIREFIADRSPNKREVKVDELLQRSEFVDFWTLQLADLLQNRKERDHDVRGVKGVRSFHQWLRKRVAENQPWDQLVRSLLTATGSATDHPEVGYFITTIGEKPPTESEVVDSVAQAFLGTRIGCARCHNHPLERYTQDDFYHFAAFFGRVSLERRDLGKGDTELIPASREERDRQRELEESRKQLQALEARLVQATAADLTSTKNEFEGKRRDYAERKRRLETTRNLPPSAWQPRTKQNTVARPLDRSEVNWDGTMDPRQQLAEWITSPTNEAFSGAMVNRVWKHFLGVGLIEPVDDLRASNPPSNEALWKHLNREFVDHGFDLRHLMRHIVRSRTYQLSSQTMPGNETDTRFHSHYYARRLPAEVLLDAVSTATDVPDTFSGHPVGLRAVQVSEPHVSSYFLSLFGRSERVTACACERNGDVTLPQLLHLQNGEELTRKLQDPRGRLRKLLSWKPSREQLVEELYLATVSRRPTPRELATVLSQFTDTKPDEAGSDLFWALLNSKEFAFNH